MILAPERGDELDLVGAHAARDRRQQRDLGTAESLPWAPHGHPPPEMEAAGPAQIAESVAAEERGELRDDREAVADVRRRIDERLRSGE